MTTTTQEVKSAAELERQRILRQAEQQRILAAGQARAAEAETKEQARQAIADAEQQAQAIREEAEQEAKERKAAIRKQRGAAETEAQAAMARVRKAKRKEARKAVLPFTKPKDLGIGSYMANVEAARQQAHKTGRDATKAVTRLKDEYFSQVDQAEANAMTEINKQKAGIVKDIRKQLASYSADMTKDIAKLNSGIDSWEAEATESIKKAQAEYEAAIQAQLDRPGTEVFADMKGQGLIPANAAYDSYDKTTGQLNYTTPDTRSGQEIFADLQGQNKISPNATYNSFDSNTGEVSYTVETPNFGSSIFRNLQNRGKIPKDATFISYNATNRTVTYFVVGIGATTIAETTGIPLAPDNSVTTSTSSSTVESPQNSTNVVAEAGGVAMAGAAVLTLKGVGLGVAAVPTPPTWVIGGAIIVTALIIGIVNRERIAALYRQLTGKDDTASSSAVITDSTGSIAYTPAQIRIIAQEKGGNILVFPHTPAVKVAGPDITAARVPSLPGFKLTAEELQIEGIPRLGTPPDVIIRDPFDVPELRQKASNILAATAAIQAAGTQLGSIAVKELGVSRTEYNRLFEQINEHLRQGRAAAGRRIIEDMAKSKDDVSISKHFRSAYADYLRKKAILDAARKAYVASLNPQPVKGTGSTDAKAAAIGVWLAQDIIYSAILRSLNRGETLRSAMADAQAKIKEMSDDLGLTRQQINAANAAVVYDLAVHNMTQQAIKTASIGQTQGLTATELQTKTFTAAQQSIKTVVQSAIQTKTLTKTQAKSMTKELTKVASQVTTLTGTIKLPKLSAKEAARADKGKYPAGTIVWRMGSLKGKNGVYKVIPPPYTMAKPITSRTPPKGMRRTKGTPQQTLTFIGGKVPFSNVSFDLGVTDGFIDVKDRTIKFTGGGQKTDVGTRMPGPTRGVALTGKPSLLQELAQKPRAVRQSRKRAKDKPINLNIATLQGVRRSRLSTGGVYSDKKGERLARKQHRGWKRIY